MLISFLSCHSELDVNLAVYKEYDDFLIIETEIKNNTSKTFYIENFMESNFCLLDNNNLELYKIDTNKGLEVGESALFLRSSADVSELLDSLNSPLNDKIHSTKLELLKHVKKLVKEKNITQLLGCTSLDFTSLRIYFAIYNDLLLVQPNENVRMYTKVNKYNLKGLIYKYPNTDNINYKLLMDFSEPYFCEMYRSIYGELSNECLKKIHYEKKIGIINDKLFDKYYEAKSLKSNIIWLKK
jgi:hypothetical protein